MLHVFKCTAISSNAIYCNICNELDCISVQDQRCSSPCPMNDDGAKKHKTIRKIASSIFSLGRQSPKSPIAYSRRSSWDLDRLSSVSSSLLDASERLESSPSPKSDCAFSRIRHFQESPQRTEDHTSIAEIAGCAVSELDGGHVTPEFDATPTSEVGFTQKTFRPRNSQNMNAKAFPIADIYVDKSFGDSRVSEIGNSDDKLLGPTISVPTRETEPLPDWMSANEELKACSVLSHISNSRGQGPLESQQCLMPAPPQVIAGLTGLTSTNRPQSFTGEMLEPLFSPFHASLSPGSPTGGSSPLGQQFSGDFQAPMNARDFLLGTSILGTGPSQTASPFLSNFETLHQSQILRRGMSQRLWGPLARPDDVSSSLDAIGAFPAPSGLGAIDAQQKSPSMSPTDMPQTSPPIISPAANPFSDIFCPICNHRPGGLVSNRRSYLAKHMQKHNPTKIACGFCGKECSRKDNRNVHENQACPKNPASARSRKRANGNPSQAIKKIRQRIQRSPKQFQGVAGNDFGRATS
jgi:hypothetical protein